MSSLESLLFGNTVDNDQSEREAAEELDLWVHTFLYTINWTWTDDKYTYLLQSNAQFTFDIKPESVSTCQDKSKTQQQQQHSRSLDEVLDAATYEKLVNYLDYELPLQQQQQQQQQHTETFSHQQSIPSSTNVAPHPVYQPITSTTTTTTTTTNNTTNGNTTTTARRPLLLPKPAPLDPLQLAASFIQQSSLPQHLSIVPPPTPTMTPTSSSGRKKTTGTKRTAAAAIESEKTEEQIAAEEDKRRRNTAASARFRIKKKQREQAMEQTVREMKAKSDQLQERVVELEQEVKWLRGLLLEK